MNDEVERILPCQNELRVRYASAIFDVRRFVTYFSACMPSSHDMRPKCSILRTKGDNLLSSPDLALKLANNCKRSQQSASEGYLSNSACKSAGAFLSACVELHNETRQLDVFYVYSHLCAKSARFCVFFARISVYMHLRAIRLVSYETYSYAAKTCLRPHWRMPVTGVCPSLAYARHWRMPVTGEGS